MTDDQKRYIELEEKFSTLDANKPEYAAAMKESDLIWRRLSTAEKVAVDRHIYQDIDRERGPK